jgi:hypothetical protein
MGACVCEAARQSGRRKLVRCPVVRPSVCVATPDEWCAPSHHYCCRKLDAWGPRPDRPARESRPVDAQGASSARLAAVLSVCPELIVFISSAELS